MEQTILIGFSGVSLKYLRPTTLDCNDIGVRQLEFVAKTQYPYSTFTQIQINVNLKTIA